MASSGWAWPEASTYAHYYIKCQSICMTSAYFHYDLEDFNHDSADNCHQCQRKLWRMQSLKKKAKLKGPLKVSIGEMLEHEKWSESMTETDNQEDLNWGADKRFLPKITAFIQKYTQITWLKHVEPTSVTVALFPPLLIANIALPFMWGRPKPVPFAKIPLRSVFYMRIGWRRDMNSGEYYLGMAGKKVDRSRLW